VREVTTLANPCVLCAQTSGHHPACPDYEPPPRYFLYTRSPEEDRLAWKLIKLCQGWPADKLPPFPGDIAPKSPAPAGAGIVPQVKAAHSMAEFAGRFTTLTRTGPERLKGCCPIHAEKTPSFYVYENSQSWRCYGACAEGGDVFTLVQRLMDKGVINGHV
jgi:hypothetical protein